MRAFTRSEAAACPLPPAAPLPPPVPDPDSSLDPGLADDTARVHVLPVLGPVLVPAPVPGPVPAASGVESMVVVAPDEPM